MEASGPVDQPPTKARRARWAVGASLAAVAILLVAIALVQLRTRGTSVLGPGTSALRLGPQADDRLAPAFSLPALDGSGSINLRDYRGQIVVLNFWASWCAPCRREAPQLEATWERYRDRGVRFLGVDHADARDDALAFQREFGITYPSVFDPAGALAERYGLAGIPTTVIIRPSGRIAYRILGATDEASLGEILDRLLGRSS